MKKCTKCGVEKPLSVFGFQCKTKGVRRAACNACMALAMKGWRDRNPDKARAVSAAQRATPNPKRDLQVAAWHAANPDRVKQIQKKYRETNADKTRLATRRWTQANPEANRIKTHTRRARLRRAGGTLSRGLTATLYAQQNGKCPYCGVSLDGGHHLDHKMPLALGGANADHNIQLLCPLCNRRKGAKHPDVFAKNCAVEKRQRDTMRPIPRRIAP